jgi:hypothetical protein
VLLWHRNGRSFVRRQVAQRSRAALNRWGWRRRIGRRHNCRTRRHGLNRGRMCRARRSPRRRRSGWRTSLGRGRRHRYARAARPGLRDGYHRRCCPRARLLDRDRLQRRLSIRGQHGGWRRICRPYRSRRWRRHGRRSLNGLGRRHRLRPRRSLWDVQLGLHRRRVVLNLRRTRSWAGGWRRRCVHGRRSTPGNGTERSAEGHGCQVVEIVKVCQRRGARSLAHGSDRRRVIRGCAYGCGSGWRGSLFCGRCRRRFLRCCRGGEGAAAPATYVTGFALQSAPFTEHAPSPQSPASCAATL